MDWKREYLAIMDWKREYLAIMDWKRVVSLKVRR